MALRLALAAKILCLAEEDFMPKSCKSASESSRNASRSTSCSKNTSKYWSRDSLCNTSASCPDPRLRVRVAGGGRLGSCCVSGSGGTKVDVDWEDFEDFEDLEEVTVLREDPPEPPLSREDAKTSLSFFL